MEVQPVGKREMTSLFVSFDLAPDQVADLELPPYSLARRRWEVLAGWRWKPGTFLRREMASWIAREMAMPWM